MKRFVEIDEIVANAQTLLKGATELETVFFRQWAYLAQRDIGVSNDDIETSTKLYVNDFAIRKPDDLTIPIDLALYTSSGEELITKYQGYGKKIKQEFRSGKFAINISEDGGFYYLSSNATNASYLLLRYYGLPIDTNGYPKIPERNILPVMMFIRWMWSMRQDDNRSAIEQNERTWLRERAKAAAKNRVPTQLDALKIQRSYMSMINKAIVVGREF